MNTQYFLYAIEVERTGSITHAAKNLFMSQPTLSKAIKDLEETLGFAVFRRTSRGMVPTRKGAEFLAHARKISFHIRKMEQSMESMKYGLQYFSLAVPRAAYIARAAARYTRNFGALGMEIDILETGAQRIMEAVSGGEYLLGILRCRSEEAELLTQLCAEKELQYEMFWEADYLLTLGKTHLLAERQDIGENDLQGCIEVTFGEGEAAVLQTGPEDTMSPRRILVQDRATMYAVLRENPGTYAWASPMPGELLQREDLVQRRCPGGDRFADVIISRVGRRLSQRDREFLRQLTLSRNETLREE